jgi:eukaryotic-like serine/threonine-protein kinase
MSTTNEQKTLAQRMTEGKIPVSEALHYAMSLAEALRKLHDAGKFHGAVTPSTIVMTGTGLDLVPSLGPPAMVTPYTAPEVLQGQPADARSDIFSFGTLAFEMLTGRPAFDGAGQTELKLAICNSAPPASGSPAVDRLVAGCIAKLPTARWQRMQKILMELKLLTVAARRADAGPATRGVSDTALHAELQKLEARVAARLAGYEKAIATMQESAAESVQTLKIQIAALHAEFVALRDRPVEPPVDVNALTAQIQAHVDQTLAAVTQEQAAKAAEVVTGVDQKMAKADQSVEEIRTHFATLQSNMAADLHDFEKSLKAQGAAIESARTAMAQTDDLVERVVEALELLQTSMMDHSDPVGIN